MKLSSVVSSAALVAGTVLVSGPAVADPGVGVSDVSSVHYTAYRRGDSAVISLDSGSMSAEHGRFRIMGANGELLAGIPLEVDVDDIAFPVEARIDGRTATLTPVLDPARAHYKPAALPFEDQAPWKTPYDREAAAWSRLTTTITMGASFGAMAGALAAGVLGCLLGGVTGGIVTGPLATLFGAGPLAGCLIGAAALAPLGVLAGSIFVGAPIAAAAVIQYFTTINAPFPKK
ncbi:hypothetical protein HGA07_18885 [Nocardia veterana]|uniref:DUF8020 domain-containing protein n=2 Tax=Nocardia veterana TaxID=132249 RepID=A0A7X6LZX0_9NOCA|nr:hypothetical protein [Nocardia veterana]